MHQMIKSGIFLVEKFNIYSRPSQEIQFCQIQFSLRAWPLTFKTTYLARCNSHPIQESSMETSGSTSHNGSRYSNTLERNSDGVATVQNKTSRFLTNGGIWQIWSYAKNSTEIWILGGSYSSTLPSSMKTNKILKSSLSKTSSLKRSSNYKFETEENLQQIVKQKRENCLQVNLWIHWNSSGGEKMSWILVLWCSKIIYYKLL